MGGDKRSWEQKEADEICRESKDEIIIPEERGQKYLSCSQDKSKFGEKEVPKEKF